MSTALPDGPDLPEAKDALRRVIRAERARLTPRTRTRAAEDLAQVVGDLPQVRAARCVAAYVARPNEPGTLPLLERLAARGTRVLLPALGTGLPRDWARFAAPAEFVAREKEIALAQVKDSGKPQEILEKMIAGKVS